MKQTAIQIHLWGLIMLLALFSCTSEKGMEAPQDLTLSEGLVNPLGFYNNNPTFSWKLPADVKSQSGYAIAVASSPRLLPHKADLWQSGKVESDQSIFVSYKGKPLISRQKVYWQVQYFDENGNASPWSEIANFELGLLQNSDWQGKWVSIPASELKEKERKNSVLFRPQYMRKALNIDSKIKSARLYVTAKGVFEAYINGAKVGNDVMAPGWTPSNKSISTLIYDVSDMLLKGENTLGAILAQGWYAGRISLRRNAKIEDAPFFLCQLEIETSKGKQIITTDESWSVSINGPIRKAEIYDGEFYDAHYELGDWNKNGYNAAHWFSARTQPIEDSVMLLPKRYQTVKDQQVLETKELTIPVPHKPVFNLGQNNVGVPLVNVPMKKGDTLVIRFAEMLNTDGTMYTKNYRGAKSTDTYIAAKDGIISYRPTFTFHGYQYVELSGFAPDAKPEKNWVKAIVQHSNFDQNGTFSSSHKKLNQLQSNITWGLRGNFFDVPTDCPQRDERLGWTGDAQVIAPTSIFYANMSAFWASYLQSMRQEQLADGGIPIVIPNALGNRTSSGWGDACVVIPWEIYFRTGNTKILEENYEMMLKWIDYYTLKSKNYAPQMFSFCDWLQPHTQAFENKKMKNRGDTPAAYINMAYFARSIELTIKTAKVLGKTDDAERLQKLHTEVKNAFEQKYFNTDGRVNVKLETQTEYLLAIEFNLLSKKKKQMALQHLIRVINACDKHLRTGFLGTPILPFVLDKAGEVDLMYEMLFKETYPSWFYSINQGATTMWERWDSYTLKDGFKKQGMNSFNHYAYGAIGQWMYERIAGIKPVAAGYKEIQIAPIPGGPLTSAEASYDCPYGKVSSAWKLENGTFNLQTTIPPNTTATLVVPGNTEKELLLNGHPFSNNEAIKLLQKGENGFELIARPGTYFFTSIFNKNE